MHSAAICILYKMFCADSNAVLRVVITTQTKVWLIQTFSVLPIGVQAKFTFYEIVGCVYKH